MPAPNTINKTKVFSSFTLLPLYDFDYEISNDQINYIGVFKYCPYYPSHEGIYVVYELKKNEEVTNLPHCITTEKITKCNKNYLVCLLSPPKNYLIDWPSLTKCDFVNVSWDCKYKIINSNKFFGRHIFNFFF